MPQSSLTAWLSKPATVKEPRAAVLKSETHEPERQAASWPPLDGDAQQRLEPSAVAESHDANPALRLTKQALPPNVEIRGPQKQDMAMFKQMNSLLLPIPYPESFYRETLGDELTRNITLFAFWHDSGSHNTVNPKPRLVGAIRCRLFAHPLIAANTTLSTSRSQKDGPMLYLSTLVLLSPYRGHGIAVHLLNLLIQRAIEDYGIGSIGAHVWEANAEGLEWYGKRGFKEIGRETGYYRKLTPSGGVIMRREVGVLDLASK
jgi:ribosomal protein S18 acetylase RimI-like enzyme